VTLHSRGGLAALNTRPLARSAETGCGRGQTEAGPSDRPGLAALLRPLEMTLIGGLSLVAGAKPPRLPDFTTGGTTGMR
jgi:hypothetical protein